MRIITKRLSATTLWHGVTSFCYRGALGSSASILTAKISLTNTWSRIDVPSCNFGGSPGKNPDIAASHGASMMRDPAWNRLVFGVIS